MQFFCDFKEGVRKKAVICPSVQLFSMVPFINVLLLIAEFSHGCCSGSVEAPQSVSLTPPATKEQPL